VGVVEAVDHRTLTVGMEGLDLQTEAASVAGADADLCRDLPHRAAADRGEHDPRPFNMVTGRLRSSVTASECCLSDVLTSTHTVCAIQTDSRAPASANRRNASEH
jgi:hypothetical protein